MDMEVEEANLVQCSVGSSDSMCHLTTFNSKKGLKLIKKYKLEHQQLIS
jgi:hypothetical protein